MKEVIPKIRPKVAILMVGINDLGLSISKDRLAYGNPFDRPGWRYRILAHSRLAQVLYRWELVLFGDVYVVKKARHENYAPSPLANQMPLPGDLKTLLPQLSEYRENIKAIIQEAKLSDVRPILLTQPMLFDDTEYWRGIEGEF